MKIATGEIMRNIDKYCAEQVKMPSIVLMENAALKVVKNISGYNSFTIICGKGNNGGDGFAAARHLYDQNKYIDVFLVASDDNMSEDCRINYNILLNLGVNVTRIKEDELNLLVESLCKNEVTIDAIFGTGLSKAVEDIYSSVISLINEHSKCIISIDVPSGFNSDNGNILGCCVAADKTISFQLYKRGFLKYGSELLTGEVIVEDIGIPEIVIDKFHKNEFLVDEKIVQEKIKVRSRYSHKGDFGRVLILAGSRGYSGAAYLSTQAAVRAGSGLVTVCSSKEVQDILSLKLTEAMTVNFEEKQRIMDLINNSDAIAVGPGMGNNAFTFDMVSNIILNAKCPVVLDADGISVLKDNLDILKNKNSDIILTPHPGEMSKVTGKSIQYINENRIGVAVEFAQKYGVILLLKGYNTIITDGKKTFVNTTGNSAMASGGMGDCLTGMIASFIGQRYKPIEAAFLSAFLHGAAGDNLSKKKYCVSASDIIDRIPFEIKNCSKIL